MHNTGIRLDGFDCTAGEYLMTFLANFWLISLLWACFFLIYLSTSEKNKIQYIKEKTNTQKEIYCTKAYSLTQSRTISLQISQIPSPPSVLCRYKHETSTVLLLNTHCGNKLWCSFFTWIFCQSSCVCFVNKESSFGKYKYRDLKVKMQVLIACC